MDTAAPRPSGLAFSNIAGWTDDSVEKAWPAFVLSADQLVRGSLSLRTAKPSLPGLHAIARLALTTRANDARQFFETWFEPERVSADGFVTAYYEPNVDGALARSDTFRAPILARPRDLATRRLPYPDRRAIRAGAIDAQTEPVIWLRDDVEVFLIQVQGSARVQLPDGSALRLVYDGRNGRPYSSIGRALIAAGAIAPEAMSLSTLKGWLRDNGAGAGGPADAVMDGNESYVFFRAEPVSDPTAGPIGGQGVALTAGRSLAIDRSVWCYGLPFWIDAALSDGPFRRLMVAQDTGSAIVGPARGDLFLGSGDEAGARAGLVRHRADVVVFRPKSAP